MDTTTATRTAQGNTEVTKALSQYVVEASYLDFPKETIELTKALLLKTVTGMVVGSKEPVGRRLTRYVSASKGSPEVGLVGGGFRTSVDLAALAHGVFAHGSEYEDDQFPGMVGTYWVYPAIFPLAEHLVSDGREIITAAASCWEIAGRLGLAGDPITGMRGYEACAYYGVVATAAAAAKLLKLDVGQTINTLSLAASHSSGLICQIGTDGHFIESGHSCRAGIMVAMLAKDGATGQPDVIERKGGLLDVAGVDVTPALLARATESLGKPPFNVHKIWIKKYPCCFILHPGIDALKIMLQKHNIKYANVERLDVETTKFGTDRCDRQPNNMWDIRFSFYHALGEVLLRGDVDPSTFGDEEKRTDPALNEARSKVKVICHPEWPMTDSYVGESAAKRIRLTLYTKDGKKYVEELNEPSPGGPKNPLTSAQIVDIFKIGTAGILEEKQQNRVAEIVMTLEKQRDILELMDILTFRRR